MENQSVPHAPMIKQNRHQKQGCVPQQRVQGLDEGNSSDHIAKWEIDQYLEFPRSGCQSESRVRHAVLKRVS